jgi:hypothetical protein
MRSREIIVKRELVVATESEVRVGVAKPRSEKRVAEKYIKEFYIMLAGQFQVRELVTYKTTKLLKTLQ